MTKFKQAIEWLKEGKFVRRPGWEEDSYWKLGKDEVICWKDNNSAKIHLNQLLADDWEIYKEDEIQMVKKLEDVENMIEHIRLKMMELETTIRLIKDKWFKENE